MDKIEIISDPMGLEIWSFPYSGLQREHDLQGQLHGTQSDRNTGIG
ncbi:uncharacterized protein G2W53_024811 [Senna tora]|uniref:Uncharacterized protein n=1 Tax=Senna tora TaxID=362788 RepID=A0A834TDP7_9FABA|nr:uncharacterized protein G2W53_024811 [Senna tora]